MAIESKPPPIMPGHGPRRETRIGRCFFFTLIFAATSQATRADQVTLAQESYTDVSIVTFERGVVTIRTVRGRTQEVAIGDVETLIVNRGQRFADLNEAERYLSSGDASSAITRYNRALRRAESFWVDLIVARLLVAYDRAGRVDEAVGQLIRLTRSPTSGPWAARQLLPVNMPAKRSKRTVRAIEQLDAVLTKQRDTDVGDLLSVLRYEILRRTGSPRAKGEAKRLVSVTIGPAVGSEAVYRILALALEQISAAANPKKILAALDRGIGDGPSSTLPSFLLIKGRVLFLHAQSREELMRAAWPFLRIVAHMPSDPRAADGLLEAAGVLERLGQIDQTEVLLHECLTHKALREETRVRAEAALTRLLARSAELPENTRIAPRVGSEASCRPR